MEEVYIELTKLLSKYVKKFDKKDKFFLVGFNNASFDNAFLRAFFVQNGDEYFGSYFWPNPVDVYAMATRKLFHLRPEMKTFKLMDVANVCKMEIDESRLHDAVYDVELTRNIYYYYDN